MEMLVFMFEGPISHDKENKKFSPSLGRLKIDQKYKEARNKT